MEKGYLDFILQEGEGQFIEFKATPDKSLAKESVAFANEAGGKIFIGVTDDKKVKGITISNDIRSQITDTAKNCDPPVFIRFDSFDKTLVVEIEEGTNKPHGCSVCFL